MNFDKLNAAQKEAALSIDGPLIIFAGAGTGKTRALTYRIANLIEKGIHPSAILGVTFTNKAANEMKSRVIELAGEYGQSVWISTFHSFCAAFLRIEAKNIALTPDFLIYDYADQINLIKDCIRELDIDEKKFKPAYFADKISRAKDALQEPESFEERSRRGDFNAAILAKIYRLYQSKLKLADALDFGDLIMQTVQALLAFPSILEKYQNKFEHILVDEYQDTNHAQYMLTKLLAAKHKRICVVGDDDQSIYSWRGADISNILDFEKDYPGAKRIKLEQNYRSTPKILNAAANVIKNNNSRITKRLWTQNDENGTVETLKANDEIDEALKVAMHILHAAQNNGNSFLDFAVFYRTNAQSRVFEDTFRRFGIPYTIVGALRFYDRAEIKTIMAYLKLIYNPNDNISFKRIINSPRRGIGKTSLQNLETLSIKKNLSMWDAIPFAKEAGITKSSVIALESFAQFIKSIIDIKDKADVLTICKRVISESGYLRELEVENTIESKERIENIKELITAIGDFLKRSPDKTLAGYLTQIALVNDVDEVQTDGGKATLMTLHLAKGLEFDNVFICGLEEGLFPIRDSSFNSKELEEERRLAYVGMTRARKNLYLCWATQRTLFGKRQYNSQSRFISEAGFKDEFAVRFFEDSLRQTKQFNNGSPKHFLKPNFYKKKTSIDYLPSDDEIIKDTVYEIVDNSPYKIGAFVKHSIFGKGKIIEKSGSGDELKLVVLFETGQWKKLLAKVAKLEML
ncbi:MAG: UvrD-helicase domain-containing protein [Elusimicrobiota bacterium]|jgi:DNA helicase-2/ATP-dependent DNA helicase PcrA|nr:UvrD-helicase domain-containing protein [Elusimicrobiota bacterium]